MGPRCLFHDTGTPHGSGSYHRRRGSPGRRRPRVERTRAYLAHGVPELRASGDEPSAPAGRPHQRGPDKRVLRSVFRQQLVQV